MSLRSFLPQRGPRHFPEAAVADRVHLHSAGWGLGDPMDRGHAIGRARHNPRMGVFHPMTPAPANVRASHDRALPEQATRHALPPSPSHAPWRAWLTGTAHVEHWLRSSPPGVAGASSICARPLWTSAATRTRWISATLGRLAGLCAGGLDLSAALADGQRPYSRLFTLQAEAVAGWLQRLDRPAEAPERAPVAQPHPPPPVEVPCDADRGPPGLAEIGVAIRQQRVRPGPRS